MKTRIINVLPHKPDYDYMQDKPRPAVNWETPDGQWVGIYRNEIPDKLGEEILKFTSEFEYEVWQPDYRADKVYSHRFEDGLVHRLFPARDVQTLHGLKLRKEISSPALLTFLKKEAKKDQVIVNLNGDFCRINFEVLEECGRLPVLQTFRGTLHLPGTLILKPRLNVPASLSYFLIHQKVKKLIGRIDHVMVQNELFNDDLKKIYQGPVDKVTSGCEFEVWKPMDRQQARKEAGLPTDKTILFTSSLLIPIKQLDKLIQVLTDLSKDHDFLLVVSGHGTQDYEALLRKEAADLLSRDMVRFVGYLTGYDLRLHYCAADVFVHTSVSEGGPVAAIKAIACGTPILISDVGNVAEQMRQNGTGKLLDPYNYEQWKKELTKIFLGEKLKPFPREQGNELYDWQAVAGKFVKIFRTLEMKAMDQAEQKEKDALAISS